MPDAHVIRLRGPWKHEPLSVGVRSTRRFNCPTNLGPDERVWLVCEGVDGEAQIALNENHLFTLSGSATGFHDITESLKPYNVLTVEVSVSPEGMVKKPEPSAERQGNVNGLIGSLIGEVRLEIRPRAT